MNRLFTDQCYWTKISAGDRRAFDIFKRHYTYRNWRVRKGKNGTRIVGPVEQITLLSTDGKALFIWRKEKYRLDDQTGINCAVFRNESPVLSSALILQAEEIAWQKWPGERLFTFVNAGKIQSSNPGYCFQQAGWSKCGITKSKKLIILEKMKQEN